MDNELKRDDNATENIEFELPDAPFMADEANVRDSSLIDSADAEISVSALFESNGGNSEVDNTEIITAELTEDRDVDESQVDASSSESLEGESNNNGKADGESQSPEGESANHGESESLEGESTNHSETDGASESFNNDNSAENAEASKEGVAIDDSKPSDLTAPRDGAEPIMDSANDSAEAVDASSGGDAPADSEKIVDAEEGALIDKAEASLDGEKIDSGDNTDKKDISDASGSDNALLESSSELNNSEPDEALALSAPEGAYIGEPIVPDAAPRFEAIEIGLEGDEVESIVEEVIPISTIETKEEDDTDGAASGSDEMGAQEAPDDSAHSDNEDESTEAHDSPDANAPRMIPEDIFPDDAFAIPETDSEGNPIITDLLGNIIEDEEPLDKESVEEISQEIPELPEIDEEIPKAPSPEETYDPDKPRKIDAIFDFVELLIFTLVSVLCLTSFFVRHAVVEGGSMMNTLKDGDVLLISDLFYTPTPGDIVVVEDYTTMLQKPIVKRVIAVEGQIVRVTRNTIYINGKPIDEDYVYTDDPDYEYPIVSNEELRQLPGFIITREYYEFMVPEGEIFVMGDHRDDSTDSRVIGTVKVESVLGKALLRLFPFEKFGELE